ncbi:hypothetical protein A0H81_14478 [Grifola frondosa]|uniref:Aminoglycoside phosphotransferase domain-containing protein n=1 Tax=Grifola frondosa TaxID=5627 RepID=A0A1C7LLL4_GRIFR|nr:hypothetical protein A0H81_14478 [Grifola frondosa]
MGPILNACCCPSFVISIAGPWMCVLGATFVNSVIVQPLTDYISLGGEPDYEQRVCAVVRIFHTLSGCMHDLNMFYSPLEVSDTLISSRLFPCFAFYIYGGAEVRLTYECTLLGKAVFLAFTQHGDAVVVKFTESYCKAAHLLLAEHGLAPPLRYRKHFGGGLHVVVMDFLPGPNLALAKTTRTSMVHTPRLHEDVKEAVRLLHENGYVLGTCAHRTSCCTCGRRIRKAETDEQRSKELCWSTLTRSRSRGILSFSLIWATLHGRPVWNVAGSYARSTTSDS